MSSHDFSLLRSLLSHLFWGYYRRSCTVPAVLVNTGMTLSLLLDQQVAVRTWGSGTLVMRLEQWKTPWKAESVTSQRNSARTFGFWHIVVKHRRRPWSQMKANSNLGAEKASEFQERQVTSACQYSLRSPWHPETHKNWSRNPTKGNSFGLDNRDVMVITLWIPLVTSQNYWNHVHWNHEFSD